MQRSSAALANAGNTIDESLGLASAANNVVQDPMKVGTALKTVSLRLTKTKAEIEELGEDSDGAANSVSELRDKILALSDQKVDILDGDSYKSTFEVLHELADVWDEISQMNQQGLLFSLGGANHANVIASTIHSFQDALDARDTSLNAEGSAYRENEKFLNSIEGRIQQFQSSMEKLSSHTFSADWMKGFIGAGTEIVNVFDQMAQQGMLLPTIIGGIAAALSGLKNVGMIQLKNWGQGFKQGGQTTYTQFGARFNKSNEYGSAANGWVNNVAWFGSNRTLNDFRTKRQYRSILNKEYGTFGTLFGSKGITYTDKDALLVEKANQYLKEASSSSKKFGEVFQYAWDRAEKAVDHTNERIRAVSAGLNEVSKNADKATDKVNTVPLSGEHLKQMSSGSALGNFTKSIGMGALNMGITTLLSVGIQKLFEGIDYAVHYSENKISEGQAILDKYVDSVKAANDEITNIKSVESEFNSLATGVNDFGQNISLNTEEYQRYQEIVSQILAASPSLIAGYDAEGNALANKNTLLQEAIALQEKEIALAAQERKENARDEFTGYQERYKTAQKEALETQQLLSSHVQSLREQFASFGEDIIPESLMSALLSKTKILTTDQINELTGYINKASMLSLDENSPLFGKISTEGIRGVQDLIQQLSALNGELQVANNSADEFALFFASQTSAYKNATQEEQEYINRLVANRAKLSDYENVVDWQAMAESTARIFENGFDKNLLVNLDDLIAKFQVGDTEANTFKGDLDTLVSAIKDQNLTGVDGKPISEVEIRAMLGVDTVYDELERLQSRMGELREKFGDQVDLSGIVKIDDMRSVTEIFNKLEQAFRGMDVPADVLDRLNKALQGTTGNRSDILEAYSQLIDMSREGGWDSDSLVHMFDVFSGMDVSAMNEYIAGLQKCNDVIEALGLRAEADKDKIHDLLSAFIEGDYSLQFNQLDEMFSRGLIDARAYDAAIVQIFDTLSKTTGIDLSGVLDSFLKSLSVEQISTTFSGVKQVLDDFFNADYSIRPFMTDTLSQQIDALNELREKAKAAHDVQSYFDLGMLSDQLSRTLEISTDPVDRLKQAIDLSTTALNEQSSAGRVSYDTFRSLAAIGPEYAATLKATNGQLIVNKDALMGVIDAEKQQSSNLLSSLQNGALKRYAELGEEIKKVKQEAADGTLSVDVANKKIVDLQGAREEALALADGYKIARNSLEELTGARAQLDALFGSSTVAEDFENSWGKIGSRIDELAKKQAWGDIKNLLSTVFNDVPDDIPGLQALANKYKTFGDTAAQALNTVRDKIAEVINSDDWGGLSSVAPDGSFEIFDEELEELSRRTGLTVDYIRQTLGTIFSFDPTAHESTIDDYIKKLEEINAVKIDSHGKVANVEAIKEALSDWDNSDVMSLLATLEDMGFVLLDSKGNAVDLNEELGKLANQDFNADFLDTSQTISDLKELQDTLEVTEEAIETYKGALYTLPGALGNAVDVSAFIKAGQEVGKSCGEIQRDLAAFDKQGYKLVIGTKTVGLKEAIDQVREAGTVFGDAKEKIEGSGIDFSNSIQVQGLIEDCGMARETLEQLRDEALALGEEEFAAHIQIMIDQMDNDSIESLILRTKGDVEELQRALDAMVGAKVADAGAWGLSAAAPTIVDIRNKASEAQAVLDTLSQTKIELKTESSVKGLNNLTSAANSAANALKSVEGMINAINGMTIKSFNINVAVNQRTVSSGKTGAAVGSAMSNATSHYTPRATGVRNAKPGMALVNDGTPVNGSAAELIIKNNKKDAYIANQGRMAMVNLDRGDTVLTAKETQDVLNGGSDLRFKRYLGGLPPVVHQSTNTSTTTTTTTSNTTTTTKPNASNTSQIRQEATEQAKADTDARKEQFEKFYKEIQYMRDKDVIKDAEYYNRLASLVEQYLAGREDLLDEFRQYDVEVYNGLKQVWEDNVKKEFATLEYQLSRNLITEKEYYRQLEEMNNEYYAGKEEYLEEWRKNDLAYYNWEQSLIQKEFKNLQYQRDMDLIDDRELYNAKQKLAEKYYKNQDHYIDEWRDHQVEAYKEIKQLQKEAYDQLSSTYDLWYKLGLISQKDLLNKKTDAAYQAYNNGVITEQEFNVTINEIRVETIEAAKDSVNQAQSAVSNAISKRKKELERERTAATRPIELQIRAEEDAKYELQKQLDQYQYEVKVRLRPLEDAKYNLQKQIEDIERDFEMRLRPLQKAQKAKQREQDAVQRQYELTLRPIDKQLNALNREVTHINHYYDLQLRPLTDQQWELSRLQSDLQREHELKNRAYDSELEELQRLITQINHDYELQLRPYKDEQWLLQKQQSEVQREQELTIRPLQKELDILQRQISQINRQFDLQSRPIKDQQWTLQRQQSDIQRNQELQMRPLDDMINALQREQTHLNHYYEELMKPHEKFQSELEKEQKLLERQQELALRPIEKELNSLQRQTTQIGHYYDQLIKPHEKYQKVLQRDVELLERERELELRPLERELNTISRQTTHINKEYDARLKPLQKELEGLQKIKELQQETFDLEKSRYDLAKAQAEKTQLVYEEGKGFVYRADQDAVREAQQALEQNLTDQKIAALERQIEALETTRDGILEALEENRYILDERRLDLEEYYDEKIYPLQDMIYEAGQVIERLNETRDEVLEPIEEMIYLLTEKRLDIEDYFEGQLEPLSDLLYQVGLTLERIAEEREKVLEPLEEMVYKLSETRTDWQEIFRSELEPIQDAIYEVSRTLEDLDRARELMLRALDDRVNDLNEVKLDWGEYFDSILEPISDALYDISRIIDDLDHERELMLRGLEDRVYDLGQIKQDWEDFFESELQPINDVLYEIGRTIEDLDHARELMLRDFEDKIYDLNEQRLDIQEFYEAQLEAIGDALYDLAQKIQDLEDARDALLEPIQDQLYEIERQISEINREAELYTRSLEDQIQQHDLIIDQLNREMELINREYDDQIWALDQIQDQWDSIINPMEEANEAMHATALWGEKWHEMLAMINSDDLPGILSQAMELSQVMAQIAQDRLANLTPDYSNPGINNVTGALGTANDVMGTGTTNFTPTQIQSLADRISASLNGSASPVEGIDVGTLTKLMALYQQYKNGEAGAAEALGAFISATEALLNGSTGSASGSNSSSSGTGASTPSGGNTGSGGGGSSSTTKPPSSSTDTGTSSGSSSDTSGPIRYGRREDVDKVVALFVRAFEAGAERITQSVINNVNGVADAARRGEKSASDRFWNLYTSYLSSLSGYASGRHSGPAELAITQENGAELLASKSGGRYTLLSPGDMVFSHAQTENLWKLSQMTPNLLAGLNRPVVPKMQAPRTDVDTYTITIGDIIVQQADNVAELSKAIVNRLPNQVLQDIRRS